MVFHDKKITLKNGKECLLRSPNVDDAEQLLEYLKQTSAETDYMTRYSEEITMSIADEENFIKSINESPNSLMILVFIDNRLVGNASFSPVRNMIKLMHRASLGIAIIKEAWGLGIGAALLTEIIDCAKKAGIEQLELEVVTTNYKAISLYERFGFVKYGLLNNAFKLKDGSYYAVDLMMKKL